MANKQPKQLKIVLLGKSDAGKTCLVDRFLHDRFNATTNPTVGTAFGQVDRNINGKDYRLGIWDTAGSERYESMTRHYYTNAQGAVVCFDLTDPKSFEKAKFWVKELQNVEENIVISLAGTKADLLTDSKMRGVTKDTAQHYARSINAKYYETSAKAGLNIEAPFLDIAAELSTKVTQINAPPQVYDPNIIDISQKNVVLKKKGCC